MEGLEDSVDLTQGQFIFVPQGIEHGLTIMSPEGAKCLVMYMPRLNGDILPAKTLGQPSDKE